MPELPEVETIRRGLAAAVKDKTFAAPRIVFAGSIRHPAPAAFRRLLEGCRVEALQRRGKYLIFKMDRGDLVVHLRMTGRLVLGAENSDAGPFLRVVLPFTDGSALYFSDARKFGGLWLYSRGGKEPLIGLHRQGPDIYDEVDSDRFRELLRRHGKAMIKPLLLNQGVMAGLGNIYTDESLFRAGIHPCCRVEQLSDRELHHLYRSVRAVLEESIAAGGTSSRDYRNARGEKGSFQNRLAVYGRKGEACRCGGAIERIVVGGRGTYICPRCQVRDER